LTPSNTVLVANNIGFCDNILRKLAIPEDFGLAHYGFLS